MEEAKDTDRKLILCGNTLDEGSDILSNCFNFIPNDFVYLRICAYGNTKLTLTFVTEDNKASSSMPSLFTDEDELSHVIGNIPVGTFCYYKTVYLRKEGTDVF